VKSGHVASTRVGRVSCLCFLLTSRVVTVYDADEGVSVHGDSRSLGPRIVACLEWCTVVYGSVRFKCRLSPPDARSSAANLMGDAIPC
jgi:hypothetical protein